MHPRTALRDAVLADLTADLNRSEVDAVLDASVSATEAACLSSHHLVDFDEYREVAL